MPELLTDALAVFRLVRLAQQDSITRPVRERVLAGLHEAGWERLEELGYCAWCASIWCAAGVVVARRFCPRVWDPVARLLAFSAVAGIVTHQTAD